MATEYKLSYTANEINVKLGQIDDLLEQVNQISSDKIDEETANSLIDAKLAGITNAEEVSF